MQDQSVHCVSVHCVEILQTAVETFLGKNGAAFAADDEQAFELSVQCKSQSDRDSETSGSDANSPAAGGCRWVLAEFRDSNLMYLLNSEELPLNRCKCSI